MKSEQNPDHMALLIHVIAMIGMAQIIVKFKQDKVM